MITANATRRARFVPFTTMTPTEQAEHLVHAHGMGPDYWSGSSNDGTPLADDAAVVAWFLLLPHWTTEGRTYLHDADHEYLDAEAGVLSCEHTHDKTPTPTPTR